MLCAEGGGAHKLFVKKNSKHWAVVTVKAPLSHGAEFETQTAAAVLPTELFAAADRLENVRGSEEGKDEFL
tara:strand:+ start:917 stop:1129 length:213 start_codon:yes stop_codon:yes gene_type:complete